MRTIAFIIFLFIPLICSAASISKSQMAECGLKKNNVERLECYDNLAENIGATHPTVSSTESSGKWTTNKEVSPLDDSVNYYLSVESDQPISNRYGGTVTPVLTIRCKENTTAISIWWGVFLGIDSTSVTYRIDDEKAHTSQWSISTKREHTGKWRGSTSIPFIKKLFGRKTLLLQVTPYGENSVLTNFKISGLKDAIKPLRNTCHW